MQFHMVEQVHTHQCFQLHNLHYFQPVRHRKFTQPTGQITPWVRCECLLCKFLTCRINGPCSLRHQCLLQALHGVQHPFPSCLRELISRRAEFIAEFGSVTHWIAGRTTVVLCLEAICVKCALVTRRMKALSYRSLKCHVAKLEVGEDVQRQRCSATCNSFHE